MKKETFLKRMNQIIDNDFRKVQKKITRLVIDYIENTPENKRDNFDQLDYGTDFSKNWIIWLF